MTNRSNLSVVPAEPGLWHTAVSIDISGEELTYFAMHPDEDDPDIYVDLGRVVAWNLERKLTPFSDDETAVNATPVVVVVNGWTGWEASPADREGYRLTEIRCQRVWHVAQFDNLQHGIEHTQGQLEDEAKRQFRHRVKNRRQELGL